MNTELPETLLRLWRSGWHVEDTSRRFFRYAVVDPQGTVRARYWFYERAITNCVDRAFLDEMLRQAEARKQSDAQDSI